MIIEAFPLKIYRTNINIDNKIILEEAKRTMNRDVPFHLNDAHNGYTSVQKRFWVDSPTYGKEFNNAVFKEIHNLIDTHVQKYIDSLEIQQKFINIKISSSYLNYGESTSSGFHDHEGALISYTYYFHLEGDLPELIFINPISTVKARYPWNNLKYKTHTSTMTFYPQVGDLFLFPGYMLHGTEVINSKFKRWLFNGDYHVYSDSIPNFP
tara:strand:+ start:5289 stop:5918 length:630 start_codon:yes stop_codon:yes gene_type:complete